MSKEEILKSLNGEDNIIVCHKNGNESQVFREENGLWKVKTFMGNLFYTDEELTEEMEENWDVDFIL